MSANNRIKVTEKSILVYIFGIALVLFWQYWLFRFGMSYYYFHKGNKIRNKAFALPDDLLTKKVVLLQQSLKSFSKSLLLNPLCSKCYLAYGDLIFTIAQISNIRFIIDETSLGITDKKMLSFYSLAKRYYAQAIVYEPTNPAYYLSLAELLHNLGFNDLAEKALKKAQALAPYNVSIYLSLLRLYISMNDEVNFNFYFKRLIDIAKEIKIGSGGPMDESVRGFLRSLGKEELLR